MGRLGGVETPAVYIDTIVEARSSARLKGLLNSGAEDFELVLPRSIAKEIWIKKNREM